MLVMSFCDSPDILKIMRLIRMVIMIVKIVVPLALMISLMLGFVRAIIDKNQDALQKELNNATKKMISAVLIFLIPTFVTLIIGVASSDITYAACFNNATRENIDKAYVARAQKFLAEANESLSRPDYLAASTAISNIKDEEQKEELKKQLDELKEKMDEKEKSMRNTSGAYMWPIKQSTSITACFGAVDEVHDGHGAIDIGGVTSDTPIFAIAAGTVTYPKSSSNISHPNEALSSADIRAGKCIGCGNYVTIDHENGITSTYCHLSPNTITVVKGDYVSQGDILGYAGTSGCSTGYHLHLAIKQNGTAVDPLLFVHPVDVSNPDRCN